MEKDIPCKQKLRARRSNNYNKIHSKIKKQKKLLDQDGKIGWVQVKMDGEGLVEEKQRGRFKVTEVGSPTVEGHLGTCRNGDAVKTVEWQQTDIPGVIGAPPTDRWEEITGDTEVSQTIEWSSWRWNQVWAKAEQWSPCGWVCAWGEVHNPASQKAPQGSKGYFNLRINCWRHWKAVDKELKKKYIIKLLRNREVDLVVQERIYTRNNTTKTGSNWNEEFNRAN